VDASTVNLNEESEMIYVEMLEIAVKIHPNARVRKSSDISRGTWEIYIPTAVEIVDELPERFDGTPAAAAATDSDTYNTSSLAQFSRKNGYEKLPIDCAADYFNLEADMLRIYTEELEKDSRPAPDVLHDLGPQFAGMRATLDMTWMD
jgi:hypothetical protein